MTMRPISLVDRAGLDRPRLAKILSRGLDGADDGELFLEYRQSEALAFDNGRLKQATYDTSQGFGLRAVKDEAVGYAHASDVSEAAIERAADAVRAVKGGYSGRYAAPPARTNVKLYGEDSPLASPSFEAKARLLQTIDAYARAKDPRVRQVSASVAASWQAVEILRGDGETYRDVRPLVRVHVSVVVGDGARQETGSDGYGGREGYARFIATDAWQGAVDNAVRQALVNLEAVPAPAGEMDVVLGPGWPGVMLHEAVGHGLEGDFNRKKTSAFAGLHGTARRRQGRHRGRRRHHDGPPRLALDRRRRHADQPHRADRGRHPGRLYAGPPERPADGHEADRQRPARKFCPRADAAHDQHLHARRQRAIPARSSPRSRTASTPLISAAARSTSLRANTCSNAPRPTASRTAK